MAVRAKRFEYEVEVDRGGAIAAEGCDGLAPGPEWTADHLLLAALVRCSLHSLRFHAERLGADAVGSGVARGVVTRREEDGRYAFVELEAELDVEVEPAPDDVGGLLAKAERDCFVGASLTVKPSYRWRVNGRAV